MFRFLRIERPITPPSGRPRARRRSPAACGGCSRRRTRSRTRPCRAGMIWRNASPTTRSERVNPGRSAFVESPRSRSTPRLPSSASLPTSVRSPSTGVWSSFQSPVWKTRPGRRLDADADRVRDRVRHAHELEPERPEVDRPAVGVDLAQLGGVQQAVLVELRLDEPERQPGRADLVHAHLAQQVRQRADVILVRVREDDGQHLAVPGGSRSRAGSGRRRGARRAGTRARRR